MHTEFISIPELLEIVQGRIVGEAGAVPGGLYF